MKKIVGIGIIIGLALAAGVVGGIIADLYAPAQKDGVMGNRRDAAGRGDLELFYTAKTIISLVNIALSIALLIIYIGIYREIKSNFTVSLIIVMLVLLLYSLTSNPLLHSAFRYYASGLGPFAMLPDLFTTIALIILLYLSLE